MKPVIGCVVLLTLVFPATAVADNCNSSPRIVGVFGAMDKPVAAVAISDAVLNQLPDVKIVRDASHTTLSSSGEQVVMYDSAVDESVPNPKIAIVVNGVVATTFDVAKFVPHAEQAIYQTSCQLQLHADHSGFVVAYTLSGDGTGSAFVLLFLVAGKYQVVFSGLFGQGRLVFQADTMKLWERTFDKSRLSADSPNFECEWCDHRYLVTTYRWRDDKYVKIASSRTKKTFDPAQITGTPVVINALLPATK